jgi:hypothetical protein
MRLFAHVQPFRKRNPLTESDSIMNLRQLIRRITTAAFAVAAALALPGTGSAVDAPETPLNYHHPRVKEVMSVQTDVTPGLMSLPEILGTAVGQDEDGEITLVVFVNAESKNPGEVMRALPRTIKGARVSGHLTDRFRAVGKPGGGGGGVSHTAKQTPPIQLGTSGGWRKDLANGYCCGGTLGSLIQVNGIQYILSNYHVFESDIVPGGNGIVANTGDNIIQPGLIDVGCNAAYAQNVATLVKVSSLPNNNVDCSVAQVISGMVKTDGSILDIGTISASTLAPKLNQAVKKSGRTTGLTSSKITGLNATINVAYGNECAGGIAFTKTFTRQIVVANSGKKFLNSGDSGSLMVENVSSNPRAIGLLYAGSSTTAIANPIGEVLTFLGGKLGGTATMVGK